MGISHDANMIAEDLGVKVSSLYQLSNRQHKNYRKTIIKKSNGKSREISIPCDFLKYIQRQILDKYLCSLSISKYSTAYCKGKSLIDNARPHIGSKKILKLDIASFFDSITFEMVYAVMMQLNLDKASTGLLTGICTLDDTLPQGAPTSPYIANLVMKSFDERLGAWCGKRGITYSRYCDDMTFSGSFDENAVIKKTGHLLYISGFDLNKDKTTCIPSFQRQCVTGIVVNEKLQLSSKKRRQLRQEVYYCCKYGVDEKHLEHVGADSAGQYLQSLLGRISFALHVNPKDTEMEEYFNKIKELIARNVRL